MKSKIVKCKPKTRSNSFILLLGRQKDNLKSNSSYSNVTKAFSLTLETTGSTESGKQVRCVWYIQHLELSVM